MKDRKIEQLEGLNLASWSRSEAGPVKKLHHLKTGDYYGRTTLDNETIVGSCSIEGWKYEQQDCLDSANITHFDRLNDEQRTIALKETFAEMQKTIGNRQLGGSTANATIAWIETTEDRQRLSIYNAHVGDSTAYLVVLDEKSVISTTQLNRLHIPNSENHRLTHHEWSIAMDRSIGDKYYEPVGLHHTADISSYTFELPKGQRAVIVTACDGLTEGDSLDEKSIGKIIHENLNKPEQAAIELVKTAILGSRESVGSVDNISVSVAEIQPGKSPVSLAVFDGHGKDGRKVAFQLAESFHKSLQKHVMKMTPSIGLLSSIYSSLFKKQTTKTQMPEAARKHLATGPH